MSLFYDNFFPCFSIGIAGDFNLYPDFDDTQPFDHSVVGLQDPVNAPSNGTPVVDLAQNDCPSQLTLPGPSFEVQDDQTQLQSTAFSGSNGSPTTEVAAEQR